MPCKSEDAIRIWPSVVVAVAIGFLPARALAQQVPSASAALVHAEGEVYLDDRAVAASSQASVLPDVVVLRTSQGRAAIALKRGGLLFLDADTSVRVFANGVYNFNRVEVLTGSAIVASGTSSPLVECESSMSLSDAGMFRFDIQRTSPTGERSCQFRVFEGAAAVPLVSVTSALRAGQRMMCNRRCGDMVPIMGFSRDQLDDFDQWARRMHQRLGK
jgi:hypothetical protein